LPPSRPTTYADAVLFSLAFGYYEYVFLHATPMTLALASVIFPVSYFVSVTRRYA